MPDSQTIIATSALIAAIFALYTYFAKVVHFMDNEKNKTKKLKASANTTMRICNRLKMSRPLLCMVCLLA